eukprot:GHVN01005301.1.p1 GENE.GHVN01005301.1~~GHVN01005301.1.p1  ORF type:complete len:1039 (-),score=392.80 GHVN01005301.1:164-3280(-)
MQDAYFGSCSGEGEPMSEVYGYPTHDEVIGTYHQDDAYSHLNQHTVWWTDQHRFGDHPQISVLSPPEGDMAYTDQYGSEVGSHSPGTFQSSNAAVGAMVLHSQGGQGEIPADAKDRQKPYYHDGGWWMEPENGEPIQGVVRPAPKKTDRLILEFPTGQRGRGKKYYRCEICYSERGRTEWVFHKNYVHQHIPRHHRDHCEFCTFCQQSIYREIFKVHVKNCSGRVSRQVNGGAQSAPAPRGARSARGRKRPSQSQVQSSHSSLSSQSPFCSAVSTTMESLSPFALSPCRPSHEEDPSDTGSQLSSPYLGAHNTQFDLPEHAHSGSCHPTPEIVGYEVKLQSGGGVSDFGGDDVHQSLDWSTPNYEGFEAGYHLTDHFYTGIDTDHTSNGEETGVNGSGDQLLKPRQTHPRHLPHSTPQTAQSVVLGMPPESEVSHLSQGAGIGANYYQSSLHVDHGGDVNLVPQFHSHHSVHFNLDPPTVDRRHSTGHLTQQPHSTGHLTHTEDTNSIDTSQPPSDAHLTHLGDPVHLTHLEDQSHDTHLGNQSHLTQLDQTHFNRGDHSHSTHLGDQSHLVDPTHFTHFHPTHPLDPHGVSPHQTYSTTELAQPPHPTQHHHTTHLTEPHHQPHSHPTADHLTHTGEVSHFTPQHDNGDFAHHSHPTQPSSTPPNSSPVWRWSEPASGEGREVGSGEVRGRQWSEMVKVETHQAEQTVCGDSEGSSKVTHPHGEVTHSSLHIAIKSEDRALDEERYDGVNKSHTTTPSTAHSTPKRDNNPNKATSLTSHNASHSPDAVHLDLPPHPIENNEAQCSRLLETTPYRHLLDPSHAYRGHARAIHSPRTRSQSSPSPLSHSTFHQPHSPNHSPHSPNHSPHSPNHSPHSPNHSPHSPNHYPHSPNHSPHSPNHSPHSPNHSPPPPNHSPHSPNRSPHSQNQSPHSQNQSPHSANHHNRYLESGGITGRGDQVTGNKREEGDDPHHIGDLGACVLESGAGMVYEEEFVDDPLVALYTHSGSPKQTHPTHHLNQRIRVKPDPFEFDSPQLDFP